MLPLLLPLSAATTVAAQKLHLLRNCRTHIAAAARPWKQLELVVAREKEFISVLHLQWLLTYVAYERGRNIRN